MKYRFSSTKWSKDTRIGTIAIIFISECMYHFLQSSKLRKKFLSALPRAEISSLPRDEVSSLPRAEISSLSNFQKICLFF